MSMLEGAVSGLASAGAQQLFADYNREKDFENYKEAQEQNYINAQDMQRNAPMLTKLGMAAAGLNPANMSNPTPATPASAPLGHHDAPNLDFAASINAMSDANLKDAQAEQINLQNENMRGENESSYENYINQAKSMVNLYRERDWNTQADAIEDDIKNLESLKDSGKLKFNAGNLRGAVNAFNTVQAMQERLTNSLDQMVKTETNYRMLVDNQSFNLSKMPEVQRNLLMAQISTQISQAALFSSQKDLSKEQINELVKLQEKLQTDIDKAVADKQLTEAQAHQIQNADWKTLFKDRKFFDAFVAKADETEKQILNQLGAILGFTAGGRALKSLSTVGKLKTFLSNGVPNE